MAIRNVTNVTGHTLLFINTESSRDNRWIPPNTTMDVGGAWVPWCTKAADFPVHHFEIIDADTDQVLWYIWQRWSSDGDLIRASSAGFEDPGPPINGNSGTSGDRNLWVDGGVTANDV
jgi:hypothetical protein